MKIRTLALACGVVLCIVLAVLSAGCTGNTAQNVVGDITVVSDSALKEPVTDIITAYQAKYINVNVRVSYGSSSDLASSIISGTSGADDFITPVSSDVTRVVTAKPEYTATDLSFKVSVAAKDSEAAKSFVTFLKSGDGLAIFKAYGFTAE